MLKITTTIKTDDKPIIKLDDLVVSVQWTEAAFAGTHLYWRTGDLKRSLMEVGLYEKNGKIVDVTILLGHIVNTQLTASNLLFDQDMPIYDGVPACDMSKWEESPSYYLDNKKSFSILLGKDYVMLDLDSALVASYCIRSGSVLFGVDDQHILNKIQLTNLSNVQLNLIKHIFS